MALRIYYNYHLKPLVGELPDAFVVGEIKDLVIIVIPNYVNQ